MPMPSFWRKRGVASSTPAPILTAMHVLPLAPPYTEDEKVYSRCTDLRPKKRRVVDDGASVPAVLDLSEVSPEVVVQDIVATLA